MCSELDALRDAQGQPLLTLPARWGGATLGWNRIPGREARGPSLCGLPTVLVATEGRGRRWYRSGLQTRSMLTASRMVELYQGGYECEHQRWDGEEGRCIALQFAPSLLDRLLQDGAAAFQMPHAHEVFDVRIAELAHLLLDEARSGGAAGPLYAEGLTLALIAAVQARAPANDGPAMPRAPRLSTLQRQRVQALIDGELGSELNIARLAAAAAMSPHHFARAFKGSFGVTPHQHVQRRRLDAAMRMLRSQPARPIVEIALGLGFASQSHFTEVFRRLTGMTPARWRRG